MSARRVRGRHGWVHLCVLRYRDIEICDMRLLFSALALRVCKTEISPRLHLFYAGTEAGHCAPHRLLAQAPPSAMTRRETATMRSPAASATETG